MLDQDRLGFLMLVCVQLADHICFSLGFQWCREDIAASDIINFSRPRKYQSLKKLKRIIIHACC